MSGRNSNSSRAMRRNSSSTPRPISAASQQESCDQFRPLPDANAMRRRSLNDGSRTQIMGAVFKTFEINAGNSSKNGPRFGRYDHYFPPLTEMADTDSALATVSSSSIRPLTSSAEFVPRYLIPFKEGIASFAAAVVTNPYRASSSVTADVAAAVDDGNNHSTATRGATVSASTVSNLSYGGGRRVSYPKVPKTVLVATTGNNVDAKKEFSNKITPRLNNMPAKLEPITSSAPSSLSDASTEAPSAVPVPIVLYEAPPLDLIPLDEARAPSGVSPTILPTVAVATDSEAAATSSSSSAAAAAVTEARATSAVTEYWESATDQPFCPICSRAFKSEGLLRTHIDFSTLHAYNLQKKQQQQQQQTRPQIQNGTPVTTKSSPPLTKHPLSTTTTAAVVSVKEDAKVRLLYSGTKYFSGSTVETCGALKIEMHIHEQGQGQRQQEQEQEQEEEHGGGCASATSTIEVIAFDGDRGQEVDRVYLDYTQACRCVSDSDVREQIDRCRAVGAAASAEPDTALRLCLTSFLLTHLRLQRDDSRPHRYLAFVTSRLDRNNNNNNTSTSTTSTSSSSSSSSSSMKSLHDIHGIVLPGRPASLLPVVVARFSTTGNTVASATAPFTSLVDTASITPPLTATAAASRAPAATFTPSTLSGASSAAGASAAGASAAVEVTTTKDPAPPPRSELEAVLGKKFEVVLRRCSRSTTPTPIPTTPTPTLTPPTTPIATPIAISTTTSASGTAVDDASRDVGQILSRSGTVTTVTSNGGGNDVSSNTSCIITTKSRGEAAVLTGIRSGNNLPHEVRPNMFPSYPMTTSSAFSAGAAGNGAGDIAEETMDDSESDSSNDDSSYDGNDVWGSNASYSQSASTSAEDTASSSIPYSNLRRVSLQDQDNNNNNNIVDGGSLDKISSSASGGSSKSEATLRIAATAFLHVFETAQAGTMTDFGGRRRGRGDEFLGSGDDDNTYSSDSDKLLLSSAASAYSLSGTPPAAVAVAAVGLDGVAVAVKEDHATQSYFDKIDRIHGETTSYLRKEGSRKKIVSIVRNAKL